MIALLASPLTPLEDVMRHILNWLHVSVGLPWAWAIVAVTVIVRMLLVPLAVRQIHSMQNMQRFAPQMKELQKKYKGDRQKLNEELMKCYKENNINPAASCLPLLAQFPVFISLFYVLRGFSRHVPPGSDLSWMYIVPDISAKATSHWSGYVLLAIYAGSQLASTYFMSATMDKTQRILFMVLPLGFVFFIISGSVVFPAGLLLYWVTTNLWTVGQGLVTRRLMPKTPMPSPFGPKRTSRTSPPASKSDGKTPASARATTPKPQPAAPRRVKKKKGGPRR